MEIDAGRTAGGDETLIRLKEAEFAPGTTTCTVKSELEALGVAPIFEPMGSNARSYLRADLAQADFNI
ncbi:hypothetical protein [Rhizobium oryziradicis]|uniref:hypothetical protein n=1 Tax=Rhizobium oryziradicis TaxID=1867956 RepID=UPI0009502F55|nr:hypothetical protein [Rhizobium oryziradicis]